MSSGRFALAAAVLSSALGHPTNIGCDLLHNSGSSIMTTSSNIMGAAPASDNDLATTSTSSFTAGSTVTISFGSNFVKGFVHVTAGTLNAAEFTATSSQSACQGSQMIKYRTENSVPTDITWTAPSDVSALPTATLSVAGAKGYGTVYRKVVTLTRGSAATTTVVDSPTTGGSATSATTGVDSPTTGGSATSATATTGVDSPTTGGSATSATTGVDSPTTGGSATSATATTGVDSPTTGGSATSATATTGVDSPTTGGSATSATTGVDSLTTGGSNTSATTAATTIRASGAADSSKALLSSGIMAWFASLST
eukprot:TRINITY_DN1763_c0_g1_i1.p1 TRINITY_DN1763_c0_g1~~TRINITY_DN1763_c0_g1_i1.p1  ORF type:complete len:338 (+),score=25.13 TRINITY_DN1763_c0_g1_i1:81-1016(+)